MASVVICPKPNVCCEGCCNPNTHCCVAGSTCTVKPTCNACTEDLNTSTCTCEPKNNGCNTGAGEHPCGTGCCTSGEACDGGCFCIPI